MPKGLYELSTGFDSNNLVNLQIDTFERMNKFQEDLNIPDYKPISIPESEDPSKVNFTYIPKDIDPDTIIKGNYDLPSLKDGLLSPDPKIRQLAKNIVEKKALSNPVTYGVGTDQYVPYTEGQNKFTNKNIFKGKKQTMFGYDPYVSMAENEDFYNKNVWNSYTNLGKLWRGTATFTGRTLSKAVTGLVGMVGDLGSIVWNGLEELIDQKDNNFWNDVSNNWLSRKMEEADQHVKNQWLPTYKAIDYDNKGAWQKLVDPYTWTNSFADGAGFLLQFAAPAMFLGKLGQAGKLARSIGTLQEAGKTEEAIALAARYGTTIEEAKKVSDFTKFMGYDITNKFGAGAAEFLTGSNNVGGMTAHIFNTGMEALAETKENFNNTVRELVSKGMSREEAVKIAGENAPGQFWVNTAILSVSNALENKFLQKAIGNRRLVGGIDDITPSTLPENFIPKSKVGKFFESNKWGNRINFYGKNYAKASFFEGFWEENAQTAAARWARGEYDRQGDDGGAKEQAAKSFVNQLWKQTKDAIKGNDREAADSIMAGAVIGVLGNTVFSKLAGTRDEIFSPEVKDADGNVIKQKTLIKPKTFLPEGQRKAEIREKAQKVSNFINTRDAWLSLNMSDPELYNNDGSINKEVLDKKTEEIKVKLAKINSFIATTITSDDLLDSNKRENYKQRVFADYVKAHILNETGDALVSRLKEWKTKSPDELEIYGVSEEIAEDSKRWAETAENLVNTYKKIKDIRYAAPADTKLTEYQNNVSAIHSVIYDYTALKSLNDSLSAKYEQNINENNPFSEYPLIQDYNQDHIKLLKLKQKLEKEDLDAIDRENIQKQIDDLEKKNKERKETIGSLGETIQSTEGLLFPKNSNKQKESERIANYQEFFENLNNKIDLDIESEKYGQLIKEYSNESTGYQKYLDLIAYWDKINNQEADKEVAADTAVEVKNTIDTLKTEIEDLESQTEDAKTKEEKDAISKNIQNKKDELKKLEEDSLDLTDIIDETLPDEVEVPLEQQYGTDEYVDQALAYVTPFKTVNKETIDAKDENGERIKWKEIALKHGYDHDLSVFARFLQNEIVKYPDKYEAFVIKDTLELMKQRLSDKQLESFDEGLFKVGAIVVFREKGKNDFLTFKNKKLIAFSYNEKAFNYNFDERVKINAERTKRSNEEVIKFFNQEQAILEAIREKVVQDDVQVPIKISLGSLGVLPNTFPGSAFERFSDFVDKNNPITIVKPENVNEISGAVNGQVYLNIPESKTVNNKKHYIGVYTSTLTKGEQDSLQEKIYNSVQAIQLSTFKTKKEASDIIKNYLFNFFYISENNNFKIKKSQNGFKIVYVDKKGEHLNWLNIPRLKVSDKLYNTEEGFSLYEKKDNLFQPTNKISKEQYREFIHNHLLTKRKVVIQNVKDSGNKLYTDPVNAYLNLSSVDSVDVQTGDATQTTEQAVIQPITPPDVVKSQEDKLADIERRRQEELNQQTDAGYSIIALDYLFTGGRDVILSTDYLLQALVGGFTYSAKEINDIRNKYADKLGNIKDDINSGVYNQMMNEIRDVINKNYNDSKATEIFDKILKNATGFTNREGNQTSIELDKLNEQNESKINAKYDAELAALEESEGSALKDEKALAEYEQNKKAVEIHNADIEKQKQKVVDEHEIEINKLKSESGGKDITLDEVLTPGNKFTAPNGTQYEVRDAGNGRVQVLANGDSFAVIGRKSNGEIMGNVEGLQFLRYAAGKVDAKEVDNTKTIKDLEKTRDSKLAELEGKKNPIPEKPESPTQYTEAAGVSGSALKDVEDKKADIEKLEKEKQEALQPLIEEKERLEKEIAEIEKDTKGSLQESDRISSVKKEIANLRNENGEIPANKMGEFNKLSKLLRFLQLSPSLQIERAIQDFIDKNNLTDKQERYIRSLSKIRDSFSEIVQELQDLTSVEFVKSDLMDIVDSNNTSIEKIINDSQDEINETKNKASNIAAKELGIEIEKEYSADELDNFVQKHGSNQTKFIWNLIKNIAQKLGVKTRFSLEGKTTVPNGYAGHYAQGKIDNRATLLQTPDVAARVIVHELVHGVTNYIIDAVKKNRTDVLSLLTQKQINAAKKLSALLKQLQSDSNTKDFYGAKNEDEILAELTHDGFVEALKNKKLNFVEKILDYILDILGVSTNAYEEALGILKDMLENPIDYIDKGFVQSNSLYSQSNTKLDQLKQQLAEVNKKIDEVTKRFDAQIAQKQSELKALEEQSTSAKKADIEKRREELGLQKILNIFPPDQGGGFRVIVKGDKYETLVQFTKGKWDIFPKQKDGEYRASDPETGNALVISKIEGKKLVEKYLPKELIELLEEADSIKNIDEQQKFENGKIKNYISLYRKEWLQAILPFEKEKLQYYKSENYPNKDSQERIIKEQEKLIAKYDAELAALNSDPTLEPEKKAIMAFQGKTFTKLKPYTDVLQDNNRSLEDKIQALRGISDQLLAPGTAEIVSQELGKELTNLIDDLGYPAPVESEALKEISKVAKAEEVFQSTENQLVILKQRLAEAEQNKMTLVIKVLTKKIEELENQLKLEKKSEEELSPLDKLRLIANSSENSSTQITAIVPHIFEGSSFKIDFDNNIIDGYFEDIDENYTLDFYKSFDLPIFTKRTTNINNIRYYFVKHNKLGKFVVFDENLRLYNISELPTEVLNDPMFKYIENCN